MKVWFADVNSMMETHLTYTLDQTMMKVEPLHQDSSQRHYIVKIYHSERLGRSVVLIIWQIKLLGPGQKLEEPTKPSRRQFKEPEALLKSVF